MVPEGIKTEESDVIVNQNDASTHVKIGINALRQLSKKRESVKHLIF